MTTQIKVLCECGTNITDTRQDVSEDTCDSCAGYVEDYK